MRQYNYVTNSPLSASKNKSTFYWLGMRLMIVLQLTVALWAVVGQIYIRPVAAEPSQSLNEVLKDFSSSNNGAAVSVKEIGGSTATSVNQNKAYPSASLYKLFVAQRLFALKKAGSLPASFKLLDVENQWTENIQDCGGKNSCISAIWPAKPVGKSQSFDECLPKMIIYSDNICGYTMLDYARKNGGNGYLNSAGYTNTTFTPLSTTSEDVAKLLAAIASNAFVDAAASEKIYSLMKQQFHQEKLPAGLPRTAEVANKTGELHESNYSHDAAIIKANSKTYVISVLTQLDPDPPESDNTNQVIAGLSKAVYDIIIGASSQTTTAEQCSSTETTGDTATADSKDNRNIYQKLYGPLYDPEVATCCSTSFTDSDPALPGDKSYKEYPAQVDAGLVSELKGIVKDIEPNIAEYKAAASRWGIPWQAIAATHWREGSAGSNQSMVNGTRLPSASDLGGKQYIWGSADARISIRSTDKADIPTGAGGAPARRFYGKLVQDIDYASWLLIQHGVRAQFGGDPQKFIEKAQGPGLTKAEWTNTWSAYLGGTSLGYGNFGRDSGGRMGAGAIMAYLGGLSEKPPEPSVNSYPGVSDSDYDKVASGVSGTITSSGGGQQCSNTDGSTVGGDVGVSTDGFVFPQQTTKSKLKAERNQYWSPDCKNPVSQMGPGRRTDLCHHDYLAADISNKTGTPVVAVRPGRIVSAHDAGSIGMTVRLYSDKAMGGDGKWYYFAHMLKAGEGAGGGLKVKVNDTVQAGDILGAVGTSADAQGTSPHTHFDVSPVDNGFGRGYDGTDGPLLDPQPALKAAYEALPP